MIAAAVRRTCSECGLYAAVRPVDTAARRHRGSRCRTELASAWGIRFAVCPRLPGRRGFHASQARQYDQMSAGLASLPTAWHLRGIAALHVSQREVRFLRILNPNIVYDHGAACRYIGATGSPLAALVTALPQDLRSGSEQFHSTILK